MKKLIVLGILSYAATFTFGHEIAQQVEKSDISDEELNLMMKKVGLKMKGQY